MRETFYAIQNIGKLTEIAPFEFTPMSEQLNGNRHNTQNQIFLSVLPTFQLSALELTSFVHGHPMTNQGRRTKEEPIAYPFGPSRSSASRG